MEYKYKAFISYRHIAPDMQAADRPAADKWAERAADILQVQAEVQVLLPEHLRVFRILCRTFPVLLPVNRNWNKT